MRAVIYEQFGGPEVLTMIEMPEPSPGPEEVQVRVLAVAVDFIELHKRHGGSGRVGSPEEPSYGIGAPPWFPGGTACVEIIGLGSSVNGLAVGDRHLVGGLNPGAYVDIAVLPAARLAAGTSKAPGPTAFPDALTPTEAAAFDYAPVAYHTLRTAAGLQAGETVLIHAASGGTGVLAVQLAKHFGATVIGVVGSSHKISPVLALGADHVLNSKTDDIASEVAQLTRNTGPDVVWDPVGGDIFTASPELMAEGGRLVSLGSNSFTGAATVDFWPFWAKNIRLIGWGGRSNHDAHAPDIMQDLHTLVAAQQLRPIVGAEYPLDQAVDAHAAVESRKYVGKVVLVP
jgi:NADPH2:quinone reductase